MTCAPFIIPPGAVIAAGEPVSRAARLLSAHGFAPVPVVDGGGRVVGMFGPSQLATLALPMGARLAGDTFDLSFVSEPLQDIRARLAAGLVAEVGAHAVAVEPVRAGTSLDEVLLRIHRGETTFVAVDEGGKLMGTVSSAAVLAALVEC